MQSLCASLGFCHLAVRRTSIVLAHRIWVDLSVCQQLAAKHCCVCPVVQWSTCLGCCQQTIEWQRHAVRTLQSFRCWSACSLAHLMLFTMSARRLQMSTSLFLQKNSRGLCPVAIVSETCCPSLSARTAWLSCLCLDEITIVPSMHVYPETVLTKLKTIGF